MQTTVTDAGKYEKLLTLQVSESELEEAKGRAARRLSRELKIKGFRPGKAPRRIVEATVGPQRLRSEAIDDVLPRLVGDALREAELQPAVVPQVEGMKDLDTGLEIEVRVTLWPTLDEVPAHAGMEVEVGSPEVTDAEVDVQVDRLREQFADLETVARPAVEGDYAVVNLTATRNGKPVEGGSAADLLYEVGSRSLIEGLDAEVTGKSAGDIVRFWAPLPAGFGEEAGQEASYQVLVKEVKARKLPDLSDAWAADVTEFDTVEELRSQLAARIGEMKRQAARNQLRDGLLEALLAEIDVDVPDAIIESEVESLVHRFAHRLEAQGIGLSDYLRVTGQDQQVFLDDLRNQADRNVRTDLLLEAVAAQMGIEVTDEELAEMIGALAEGAGKDVEEFRAEFAESAGEKAVRSDILRRKALDALMKEAVAVDEHGSRIDLGARDEQETAEE